LIAGKYETLKVKDNVQGGETGNSYRIFEENLLGSVLYKDRK
jgi:hypothetical protein